ncbi:MAG TPA: hypothetical protein VN960_09915 [Gaiellaceae bacterium]|jgi:hypothetical protein|nr:hypothetical protein [Gaiellaceae bacterium]
MARLPTWLIVAAVGAVVALAAADAIRPTGEPRTRAPAATGPPGLNGVLLVGRPDCSTTAIRLPSLDEERALRRLDCGGLVWSRDGTLAARCTPTNGTEILTERLEFTARVAGCSPAWREDGALSVIRNGDLLIFRRRGPVRLFVSRTTLAEALAGEVPRAYELSELVWIDASRFAAILHGRQPWQQAIVVYSRDGVERFVPEAGQRISGLRVSPLGNYIAFARNALGREYAMLLRGGPETRLPRIANARTIAWSPDEEWVALATRTATFIARTGSRRVVFRVPAGGDTLAWLP